MYVRCSISKHLPARFISKGNDAIIGDFGLATGGMTDYIHLLTRDKIVQQ